MIQKIFINIHDIWSWIQLLQHWLSESLSDEVSKFVILKRCCCWCCCCKRCFKKLKLSYCLTSHPQLTKLKEMKRRHRTRAFMCVAKLYFLFELEVIKTQFRTSQQLHFISSTKITHSFTEREHGIVLDILQQMQTSKTTRNNEKQRESYPKCFEAREQGFKIRLRKLWTRRGIPWLQRADHSSTMMIFIKIFINICIDGRSSIINPTPQHFPL